MVTLKRDHGLAISESSIGRIISKLVKLGKIVRSISSIRPRRKRKFKGHAKRVHLIKHELNQDILKYNFYRSHFNLNRLTSCNYAKSILKA